MARKQVTQNPDSASAPVSTPAEAAASKPAAPVKAKKSSAASGTKGRSRTAAAAAGVAAKPAPEAAQARGLGSTVESLKQRFSARKIPLEGDFADLIDIADCGRQAVGLGPAQPGGPGYGLGLLQDGRLGVRAGDGIQSGDRVTVRLGKGLGFDASGQVQALADDGVVVSGKGIAAVAGAGITVSANGIAARPGAGVTVSASGIAVKTGPGLTVDTGAGVSASLGPGLMFDKNQAVAAHVGKGLSVDAFGVFAKAGHGINVSVEGGIAVKTGTGLTIDSVSAAVAAKVGKGMWIQSTRGIEPVLGKGLQFTEASNNETSIMARLGSGLTFSADAIVPKLGNGLVMDQDQAISVTSAVLIPKGVIVMFSGDKVPDGWALCDGKTADVPDLSGRFILGAGSLAERGGKSNSKVQGGMHDKSSLVDSEKSSVLLNVGVAVGGTALTEAQMPKHQHLEGRYYGRALNNKKYIAHGMQGFQTGGDEVYVMNEFGTLDGQVSLLNTSFQGESQSHTHTASATISSNSHAHAVNVVPPYYILAFIMKL